VFRPSRKMLYAIDAVLDIAMNGGARPVRSQDITRRQGIPRRYLEQALQQLVRHRILEGVRGPQGGYALARDRRDIAVGEIVRVVRSLETADDPLSEPAGSALGELVVRPLWAELQNDFMRRLDSLTLDELCLRADRAGLKAESSTPPDFAI
jgi:Rrf2 family iron-sulfur cluster assembly transcriptional regulator